MKLHIVREPEELEFLLQRTGARFELASAQLGPDNSLWQERLRKEHDECGCSAGAIGLLIGAVMGATSAWLATLSWWCGWRLPGRG
jgi:hypothetical protein